MCVIESVRYFCQEKESRDDLPHCRKGRSMLYGAANARAWHPGKRIAYTKGQPMFTQPILSIREGKQECFMCSVYAASKRFRMR